MKSHLKFNMIKSSFPPHTGGLGELCSELEWDFYPVELHLSSLLICSSGQWFWNMEPVQADNSQNFAKPAKEPSQKTWYCRSYVQVQWICLSNFVFMPQPLRNLDLSFCFFKQDHISVYVKRILLF